MPSSITVKKIPAQPIPPPIKDPPGKPVTGLAKVRLINNLIIQEGEKSRFVPRGEVIDINLVPEHLRKSDLIEAPDAFREGKVQLTHDLIVCLPNFDGERTTYREQLFAAHSLVDLTTLPNRVVETLVEGEDFLSTWNEDDRRRQEIERMNATEEFSMEGPEIPEDVSFGRDPHNRYGNRSESL